MGEAVFPQRNGLKGLVVAGRCGLLTPEQLAGLTEALKDLGVSALKLSTRQTLVLLLPEDRVATARERLAGLGLKVGVFGQAVRNVKACCGDPRLCPWTLGDALSLGIRLEERYCGEHVPQDLKIAVAGCPRGCTDPLCADFGAVATGPQAFDVYIGGRGGTLAPSHGRPIARGITAEGVEALLGEVLDRFRKLARPRERLCRTIARTGLEAFTPGPDWLAPYRPVPSVDKDFAAFLNGGEA